MREPRLTNEPPGILALDPFDRRIWWVGAIAQEAAMFDLVVNRLIREMLSGDEKALASLDSRKNDLMFSELKREVAALARRLELGEVHQSLAREIGVWIETVTADERNRVIHDVAATSERGIESYDARTIIGGAPKREITLDYLDEVFRKIQAQTIQAERLYSAAHTAWGVRS